MDPYVLRLVSRGKTPQTSRLEHIPRLWLRAPVRVELACSGPEDSAAALAAVSNYSLAIHSLDADRKPVDSPLLWYQVVSPAGNTGATKGPHAVFEIGTAEIANITEAGDYWIAVHAHTVDERIVRAAGYVTLLDDGFPSTPPTPTPPGTVWLTQAAGDARYINVTGDIMTGTLTLPAAGLRHAASGFDAVVIAATLTNDRELLLPDEDGTLATREWALANISGTGGGATNITISLSSTTVTVNSSTGTEETIPGATNALAGIMTAAHVISLDGKVNKSGDTMTGLLTLPDITVTNSAIFGPALAHNEISTVATAVRENQLPDANGVFALTSNTEGVPDKLGTRAKCDVAGGVTKGKVVFLNNADGSNPTFALANATSDLTSSKTYGFIDRACALNQHGVIITNGILEGLSLSVPYAIPGDSVWLSTVNGGVEVGLPPAKPAHSVYLGLATKVSNSGYSNAVIQTIEVKVQNGYELAELHDVAAAVASADQALVWNSVTNLWTPTTLTISLVSGLQTALDGKAASSHTHAIGDVTGLQTALDGKAASSHTHTWSEITGKPSTFPPDAHTHAASDINSGTFPAARFAGTATNGFALLLVAGVPTWQQLQLATRATNLAQVFNMGSDQVLTGIDPNADRLLWWNNATKRYEYLGLGTNLSVSGGNLNASGGTGSATVDVQRFSSSANWTNPSSGSPRPVFVRLIAGGGGGGGGRGSASTTLARPGGGGGGAGTVVEFWLMSDQLASSVAVTVGAAGTGGAGGNGVLGTAGTAGGATTFAGMTAQGGSAGGAGLTGTGVGGAAITSGNYIGLAAANAPAGGTSTAAGASKDGATQAAYIPTSGGAGGYIDAANVETTAGKGGDSGLSGRGLFAGGAAATTSGGAGGNGTASTIVGTGGGGGGPNNAGTGGAGGNAGGYGAGGGGGGGGTGVGGTGGNGGAGYAIIITYL